MMISVLMITYNHQRFIAQAIESVLMQRTSFNIELIIGDDCSTDDTRKIIDHYCRDNPGRIKKLYRDKNVGGVRNFVEAYQACAGRYIATLDGDDYWTDPEKLQIQVDALEAHPDWAICFHPVTLTFEDGRSPIPQFLPSRCRSEFVDLASIVQRNPIQKSSCVFRNRLIQEFPQWLYSLPVGDWALHVMNARHGVAGFIDRNMAVYRIHAGSQWSSANEISKAQGIINALRCFRSFLGPSYWPLLQIPLAEAQAEVDLLQGKICLERRDFTSAIKLLGNANKFFRRPKLKFAILGLRTVPRLTRLGTIIWREFIDRPNSATQ